MLIAILAMVAVVTYEAGAWGLVLLGLVLSESYRLLWGDPTNEVERDDLKEERPQQPTISEKKMRHYGHHDTTSLVMMAQAGDRSALALVVQRETPYLLAYASSFAGTLPATPADLVQLTWEKVLLGLPALREPRHFRTWTTRILQNVAIRESERLREADELDDNADYGGEDLFRGVTAEGVLEAYDARRMLRWLADHVDPETATIAILKGIGGLPWSAVVREMNSRYPRSAPWSKRKCESRIERITSAQASVLRRLLGGSNNGS
ncbi:MAG: RNA polymerase sigma factor [Ilumatobacter sp.]|uniref:RNA polymerase sigma factor n=1 Tax=Ilumatobacter sp. TaxID=1967498 RepID=UPI00391944CA